MVQSLTLSVDKPEVLAETNLTFVSLSLQLTVLGSVVYLQGGGVCFLLNERLYTKLCLQISTLNSTSLPHNSPNLSCFSP